MLNAHGIEFVSKNKGAYLVIGNPSVANFWPQTERWTAARNASMNGRGTQGLIDWITKHHPSLLKETKP